MDPAVISMILSSMPAWASEDTLRRIVSLQQHSTSANITKINKIAAKWGLDPIAEAVDDVIDEKNKGMMQDRRMSNETRSALQDMQRDHDPLLGMTAMVGMAGGALGKAGSAFDFLTGNKMSAAIKKSVGPELLGLANKGLGSLAAVTGFTAGTTAFINSLERDIRSMVEMSIVASSQDYTVLRAASANLGMSMVEANKLLANSGGMLASVGEGDIAVGVKRFLQFAGKIEKMNANGEGGVSDFGYSVQQLAGRMAEETNLLYQLNDLTATDLTFKSKAYKNFETMETMMTYMADWTGVRKSELLAQGLQASQLPDYQLSLKQNREYLEKTYGEGTTDAINNSRRRLITMLSAVPELQSGVQETLDRFLQDIQFNGGDAAISMSQELMTQLNVIDPSVAAGIQKLITDVGTGQYKDDPIEQDIRVKELLLKIRSAKPLEGPSETFKRANSLIMATNTIPNLDISDTEQREKAANAKIASEQADDIIDSVDNVSKALRGGYNMLAPSTETVVELFGGLTQGVQYFGQAVSSIPGFESLQKFVGEDAIGNYRIAPSTTGGPQPETKKDAPSSQPIKSKRAKLPPVPPVSESWLGSIWNKLTGQTDKKEENQPPQVTTVNVPQATARIEQAKSEIQQLKKTKPGYRSRGAYAKIKKLEAEIAKLYSDIASKTNTATLKEAIENGK